jgi:hypothetical protein
MVSLRQLFRVSSLKKNHNYKTQTNASTQGNQSRTAMPSQQHSTRNQALISPQSSVHRQVVPPVPPPQPAQQSQSQLPDVDVCWVCLRPLPSSSVPDSENVRAAHVSRCIENASRTAQGTAGSSANTSNANANANAADPPNIPSAYSEHFILAHRLTGLFPYKATEKDCVDDAECTICLENYAVGEDMARLECLCRFHLKCIKGWWERKDRQCPVHQPSDY